MFRVGCCFFPRSGRFCCVCLRVHNITHSSPLPTPAVKWELGTVAMPMRDCNAIVNAIETTQWLVEGNTNLPLMVAVERRELGRKSKDEIVHCFCTGPAR